jgi:hypothetical protein
MICNRTEKRKKHSYLRQVFERERASGARSALYKICCLYASLFPDVPEWKIPKEVFSILNPSDDTIHLVRTSHMDDSSPVMLDAPKRKPIPNDILKIIQSKCQISNDD